MHNPDLLSPSPDNDSGSQAEAEPQRARVHGGRRQDVAQGGKHPEAATGKKHIIEDDWSLKTFVKVSAAIKYSMRLKALLISRTRGAAVALFSCQAKKEKEGTNALSRKVESYKSQ